MIVSLMRLQGADLRAQLFALLAAGALIIGGNMGLYIGVPMLLVGLMFRTTRVTPFEMTVPIPVQTVLFARIIPTVLLLLSPIALWAIVWLVRDSASFDARHVVGSASGALVMAVVPFTVRPRSALSPPWYVLTIIALVVAFFTVVACLYLPLAFVVLSAVVVATTLVIRARAMLPLSYVMEPELERSTVASPVATNSASTPAGRVALWRMFRREFVSVPVLLLMVGISAMALAEVNLFYVYLLATLPASKLASSVMWHVFPLSSVRRFTVHLLFAVAPLVIMISVSVLAPLWWGVGSSMDYGSPRASEVRDRYEQRSRVPFAFWERVDGDDVPAVIAPWGERVTPWSVRLINRTYFNPFSVRETSSERFLEWQFERATTTVYGRAIPYIVYDESDNNLPVLRSRKLRVSLLMFPLLVTLSVLLHIGALSDRIRAVQRRPTLERAIVAVNWVPFLIIMLGMFAIGRKSSTGMLYSRLSWTVSQALPTSTLLAMLIASVPAGAACTLLYQVVKRLEVLPTDFIRIRLRIK